MFIKPLHVCLYLFSLLLSQSVTVLQLSQMFMGIYVNLLSWHMARSGHPCMFRYDLFYLAVTMYTSYAILFSNFFYQRYMKKAPPKAPPKVKSSQDQYPETITSNHISTSAYSENRDSLPYNRRWKNIAHLDNRMKSKQL